MSPSVEAAQLLRCLQVQVELPGPLLELLKCHFVAVVLSIRGTHEFL